MIALGEKVKAIREEKGISIEMLSQMTRISSTQLKSIEAGKANNFLGDEQYLKMYLKRIASALEVPENYFEEDFLTWTQGVSLSEIAKASEAMEPKKEKNLAYHVNDSIQQVKKKQAYSKNKKHVYEDRYLMRYLKYFIIACLVVTLVFLLWKVVSLTSQLDATYKTPDIGSVENSDKEPDDLPDEPEDDKEDDLVSSNVVITNDGSRFNISGIMAGEVLTIEVEFKEVSAFNLWNAGGKVPGAYKSAYQVDEKYVYEGTCKAGEIYTLNFWNLENTVVKVNGNIVEYDATKLPFKNNAYYMTLVFSGE